MGTLTPIISFIQTAVGKVVSKGNIDRQVVMDLDTHEQLKQINQTLKDMLRQLKLMTGERIGPD